MKLTGAQILFEIMLENDVDTVFGYPGGAALNIYDALYQYKDRIHHVLTAHEQGAAHAADGYARATGKTGVVFATSGPGATNLVTGIATAFMDSTPMVAITSNVTNDLIGRDAFQEIYITGVTIPVTKHNFFVNRIEDLEHTLREAFRIAASGRKGPVLVDITKDVTAAKYEYTAKGPSVPEPLPAADPEDVALVARLINESRKPVIYCGGGVASSGAGPELAALMEKADIPAAYTLLATEVMGCDDPRNLGMLGMHGTVAANRAVDEADLMLAFGTRFSDRVALNIKKFAKNATKVQIDIDKAEINKNVPVNVSAVADVKDFLAKLLPLVEQKERADWMSLVSSYKKTKPTGYDGAALKPEDIVTCVCDMTDDDTIYTTDVGQHQMWAAQYIKHRNTHKFLTSGGLGTMGFGYGAAIGAKVGCPDKRVIHFTSDGSFHMNMNEACTAVSEKLPVITIIMNNRVLGMVYQWQDLFYGGRYSCTDPERKTDFVKVAEGFGAKGYRAKTLDEFKAAFAKALKADGPVWIECELAKSEKVLPMIPGGGTVKDIILD